MKTASLFKEIKTVELPATEPGTQFVFVEEDEKQDERDGQDANVALVIHEVG